MKDGLNLEQVFQKNEGNEDERRKEESLDGRSEVGWVWSRMDDR